MKNFRSKIHINNLGFTLVEITIVLFGFALIVYGLIALVSNIIVSSSKQTGLLSDVDQARKVSSQITSELRNAQIGSNGAYALDTAGAQQIIFYSNADKDNSVERIRYFWQNGQLFKGITEYNGSTYNTSTEAIYSVQKNLANGSNPIFVYYADTYAGVSGQNPLSQPVNVMQVKFVQTNIQIFNKGGVKNINTYTVTSGGAIRSLKTNLGQ